MSSLECCIVRSCPIFYLNVLFCLVRLSSNLLNLDFSLMMSVVAPQSTSRAFGFPVALSLACTTSSSGSPEVPEAFFTLSVLFFPLRSYDACCTSVPVRFSLVFTITETSDMPWLATLKTGDMPLRFLFVFSLHD